LVLSSKQQRFAGDISQNGKDLTAGDVRLTFEPLGMAMPGDTPLIHWMENVTMMIEGSGVLDPLKNHWFNEKGWLKGLFLD